MKNVKKISSYKVVLCAVAICSLAMLTSLKSNSHMSNAENLGVAHTVKYDFVQASIPQPQVRVTAVVVETAERAWEGNTREAAKFVAYEVGAYAVGRLMEWLYVKNTITTSAKIISLRKQIMVESLD